MKELREGSNLDLSNRAGGGDVKNTSREKEERGIKREGTREGGGRAIKGMKRHRPNAKKKAGKETPNSAFGYGWRPLRRKGRNVQRLTKSLKPVPRERILSPNVSMRENKRGQGPGGGVSGHVLFT